jgi:N-acyl-D-aspartate/D-glutamate deacylase
VGALVGHTPVRLYVMGEEATEREATEDGIAQMERIVGEALRAGAVGFATSRSATHVGYAGRPVPSRAASMAEVERLAATLATAGRGVNRRRSARLLHPGARRARAQDGPLGVWTALLAGALGRRT